MPHGCSRGLRLGPAMLSPSPHRAPGDMRSHTPNISVLHGNNETTPGLVHGAHIYNAQKRDARGLGSGSASFASTGRSVVSLLCDILPMAPQAAEPPRNSPAARLPRLFSQRAGLGASGGRTGAGPRSPRPPPPSGQPPEPASSARTFRQTVTPRRCRAAPSCRAPAGRAAQSLQPGAGQQPRCARRPRAPQGHVLECHGPPRWRRNTELNPRA